MNNFINNFAYLLNSEISEVKQKTLLSIYFFFLLLIILSSLLFLFFFIKNYNLVDNNYNLILRNVTFDHGQLLENIFYKKKYQQNFLGINFYVMILPVLPLLITFLGKISLNVFSIILIKNIFFFSFSFYIIYKCLSSLKMKIFHLALFLLLIFYNPYNLFVQMQIVYADTITASLLPLLFLLLVSDYQKKIIFISIILFILYLTKSNMFFLTMFIPLLFIFLEKKIYKYKILFLPLFSVFVAIIIWGFFGFLKTGTFPFGKKITSINSVAMTYVLNENFQDFYPKKSTDLIPSDLSIPKNIYTEWEVYDFFEKKNSEFFKKNYKIYLNNIFIKIKFIFFSYYRDGALPDKEGNFDNSLRFSSIFNKIFINISFLILLFNFLKSPANFLKQKVDLYFSFFLIFLMLPHLYAWATSKHLVGLSIVCSFYCLLKKFLKKC
jgi:hypothetical protein